MGKNWFQDLCWCAVLVLLCLVGAQLAYGQEVKREGTNFSLVSKAKTKSEGVKTKYTFTDSKGIVYPICIAQNGRCYITRKSATTGKEYRQYPLPEDLNKEIAKEYKIPYTYIKRTKK